MVTAYCLSYGNWTVIPHQWERCFDDMCECGFDTVALSFSESEERYSRRTFEMQIETARRAGLRVAVIPSRIGGRFAGAPLMPSLWLTQHPEAQLPGRPMLGCLEYEPFVQRVEAFLTMLLTDYDLAGIVFDEPKEADAISLHPATLARFGETPTAMQMQDSMISFLQRLIDLCRDLKPGIDITLFNCAAPKYYTSRSAKLRGLDYYGYDGTLSKQSFFHEPDFDNKYSIFSMMDRMRTEASAAGVKTFALLENILMGREAMEEYGKNLERFLSEFRVDQLALYYYGHNNVEAERVHEITRTAMRRFLRQPATVRV